MSSSPQNLPTPFLESKALTLEQNIKLIEKRALEARTMQSTIIAVLRMVELRFLKEIIQCPKDEFSKERTIGTLSLLIDSLEKEYAMPGKGTQLIGETDLSKR